MGEILVIIDQISRIISNHGEMQRGDTLYLCKTLVLRATVFTDNRLNVCVLKPTTCQDVAPCK
jgi:hypothetical protein